MAKPTLHEIAAMPYPASVEAMRKHYNKHWGKPCEDGELHTWRVTVNYDVITHRMVAFDVKAVSEEEAIETAEERFEDDGCSRQGDDVEVTGTSAKIIGAQ